MLKNFSIYDKNGLLLNEFSIDFLQRKTSELKLDKQSFYLEFGKSIPEENIEMLLHETAPFTIPSLIDAKTHLHRGNDDEWYICYPKQIKTMEDAISLAKNWCLVTVFHMMQRADVSWFESFGTWLIYITEGAVKAGNPLPKPFEQFPLWIQNGYLRWDIEIS
jgi:hypothetical protein